MRVPCPSSNSAVGEKMIESISRIYRGFRGIEAQFLPQRGYRNSLASTVREERQGEGERERGRGKGRVEVLGTVVLAHLHYPRPGPKGIRVYNGRTVLRLDQLAYQTSWYECAKNETKQSKDAWTRFYEKNPSPFHGEIRARVSIFCTKKDIADLTKTPAILIISSRLGFEGEERIWINTMNGMSNKRILNNIFHFERERNRRVFWILQEK